MFALICPMKVQMTEPPAKIAPGATRTAATLAITKAGQYTLRRMFLGVTACAMWASVAAADPNLGIVALIVAIPATLTLHVILVAHASLSWMEIAGLVGATTGVTLGFWGIGFALFWPVATLGVDRPDWTHGFVAIGLVGGPWLLAMAAGHWLAFTLCRWMYEPVPFNERGPDSDPTEKSSSAVE
jgi:hypothetical protein